MNLNLPVAVVIGIENFVAGKLAKTLLDRDINVIGIGDKWPEGINSDNFKMIMEEEDWEGKVDYVFDFKEQAGIWEKFKNPGRLIRIAINKQENWNKKEVESERRVVMEGVYGPGMGEAEEIKDKKAKIMARAFRLAAENKNLVLPQAGKKIRLINENDAVEAILRVSFLSGIGEATVKIWGREEEIKIIAEVLIDKAKMTRFKVMESGEDIENKDQGEVDEEWSRIRWKPEIDFEQGAEETLQYFFSKFDEEKRKGKSKLILERKGKYEVVELSQMSQEKGENKKSKWFEVEVDEREKVNSEQEIVNREEEKVNSEQEIVNREEEKVISEQETVNREWEKVNREEKLVEDKEVPVLEINKIPIRKSEGKKKKDWRRWLVIGGMAMILMIVGWGARWVWLSRLVYRDIIKVGELVKKKDFKQAEEVANKNSLRIDEMSNEIGDWGWDRISFGRNYQSGLRVAEQVVGMEKKAIELVKVSEELSEAILKEKEIDWKSVISKEKDLLKDMVGEIGVMQGRMDGNWRFLPERWRSWPNKANKELGAIKKDMEKGLVVMGVVPEMVGADGRRREYMVLFQNENELRAGGGFIGSYGILSFEGGKLINLDVRDVYEADGQLKGHVEPPEAIKNYLGEAAWFMRDANWQADFKGVSKDIQWFLEKETGRKVDGVIGINLATAKEILGVVGEVYVPDFKEKVNKDNLYEQAEFYAETKFFPGSNQKASFLGGLSRQLFEEIVNLDTEKKIKMAKVLIDLMERNDIQMVMNNKEAAKIMADLGWDGGLFEGRCGGEENKQRCFADYLYIVESNLGVNKANYFIYRNIEERVDISLQSISRVVKIIYENTAKSTNWPGGDYKNYLRVYIPQSSNLAEISVSQDINGGGKRTLPAYEVKQAIVSGKKELGAWIIVPVGQKRVVEIRYSDQISLNDGDNYSYLNYIQRQSGFGDTGIVNLISMPDGWQPTQAEPAASVVGGKLLFNQKLDRDLRIGVEISR